MNLWNSSNVWQLLTIRSWAASVRHTDWQRLALSAATIWVLCIPTVMLLPLPWYLTIAPEPLNLHYCYSRYLQ